MKNGEIVMDWYTFQKADPKEIYKHLVKRAQSAKK